MIFGITDNFHPATILANHVSFGNAVGRVVSTFGVDVRTNLADDGAHIGLGKNHYRIHIGQSGEYLGAFLGRHQGTARSLQSPRRIVGIDGHDQTPAQRLRRMQVADMAHVHKIECAVCQDDPLAGATPFGNALLQFCTAQDFVSAQWGLVTGTADSSTCSNSLCETVAVPRFITTIPPA